MFSITKCIVYLCPLLPVFKQIDEWSAEHIQTASQVDATICTLAISFFAIWATPLSDHFRGIDWKYSGLLSAVVLTGLPTIFFHSLLEWINEKDSAIKSKIHNYEIKLEKLKCAYYKEKAYNYEKEKIKTKKESETKFALQDHLIKYKEFLRNKRPNTDQYNDLFQRVPLLTCKDEDNSAKIKRLTNLTVFCIKTLKAKAEKKSDLSVWASFLDFELALKWCKKEYRSPDPTSPPAPALPQEDLLIIYILNIFKSIYQTRLNSDTTQKTIYSQFAELSNMATETLDIDNTNNPLPSLYQLVYNDETLTSKTILPKIKEIKTLILSPIVNQCLKEEINQTINLFEAKLELLIAKRKKDKESVLHQKKLKIYTIKSHLAEAKYNQLKESKLLDQRKDPSKTYWVFSKKHHKYALYVSWFATSIIFWAASETTLPLSGTNRIAVWLLSAAIQQQAYLMINSKNCTRSRG